jgi:uncharacterized pyridoxamine 5'-phosphate oxidase family protein
VAVTGLAPRLSRLSITETPKIRSHQPFLLAQCNLFFCTDNSKQLSW